MFPSLCLARDNLLHVWKEEHRDLEETKRHFAFETTPPSLRHFGELLGEGRRLPNLGRGGERRKEEEGLYLLFRRIDRWACTFILPPPTTKHTILTFLKHAWNLAYSHAVSDMPACLPVYMQHPKKTGARQLSGSLETCLLLG